MTDRAKGMALKHGRSMERQAALDWARERTGGGRLGPEASLPGRGQYVPTEKEASDLID